MDRDRFQRVMEIFERVRDLGSEARTAYLNESCAGDAILLSEVEALLQHDAQPVEALQSATQGGGAAILANSIRHSDAPPTNPPWRIGRYNIIRLIGEGGMGAVYEAQQEQPRRTVALKVLRGGLASPSLLRRFGYEAQVLGRLQHPGIAQIIEAGVADTGAGEQPFLVMELVQGRRLDEFVREQGLVLRDRLELFVRICDAVQHAHQKGVIHRDLKPANILVIETERTAASVSSGGSHAAARDGMTGQPKVLDFGLAKLIEPDLALTAMATETGRVQGTLAYMSPEQAKGLSDEIDVRSDVYSLGIILYELMTDQLPYDVSRIMLPDAVRVICENTPRRPSITSKSLRGDLETIAFKALEKDAERRYASVASLAEDVRRYLGSQPILARPAGRAYQLRKFAKRNKGLVAGMATAIVILIAGVIVSSALALGQHRALKESEQQRRIAEALRAKAESATEQAEANFGKAVQAFEDFMAAIADMEKKVGTAKARRIMVSRAYSGMSDLLAIQPDHPLAAATMADVLHRMGSFAQELGRLDEALAHCQESVNLRQSLLAEHAGNLDGQAKLSIAWVRLGDVLNARGDAKGGREYYEKAMEIDERISRAVPDNAHYLDNLSWSYHRLASMARDRGDAETAGAFFGRQLAIARRAVELEPENPVRYEALIEAELRRLTPVSRDDLSFSEAIIRLRAARGLANCPRDHHSLDLIAEAEDRMVRVRVNNAALAEGLGPLTKMAEHAYSLNPSNPHTKRALATVLLRLAYHHEEASRALESMQDGEPDAVAKGAFWALERAEELAEGLAADDPDVIEFQSLLSDVLAQEAGYYHRLKDLEGSLRYSERRDRVSRRLLVDHEQNIDVQHGGFLARRDLATALFNLQMYSESEGMLREAFDLAEQALRDGTMSQGFMMDYGSTLTLPETGALRDIDRGLALKLDAILAFKPNDARLWEQLGNAAAAASRMDHACQAYAEAQRLRAFGYCDE